MKNTRTRKRSTSEKRKRSTSRSKDDDLLIKALNQKVVSDKQVLISKDQYEELLNIRKLFKETQARALAAEIELAKVQEVNKRLENFKFQVLNKEKSPRDMFQESLIVSGYDNQRVLDDLKSSFSDIDQVLKLKSRAGKKYLTEAQKLINDTEGLINQSSVSSKLKSKLFENIASVSNYLDNVIKIFTQNNTDSDLEPEIENVKLKKEVKTLKEKIENYKDTLERLQDQTKNFKKRLMDVEYSGNHKKTIEDQESRIDLLEQEKELLSQHIKTLQSTLTEQCQIIVHLKEAFQAIQIAKTEATSPTPKRAKESTMAFSRNSQEDYLQDEIETLDLEIQQLQQSLQKALSNN